VRKYSDFSWHRHIKPDKLDYPMPNRSLETLLLKIAGLEECKAGKYCLAKPATDFTIYTTIPPYLTKKGSVYYAFKKADLGIDVQLANRSIKVARLPHVLNLPYPHPNIFDDGAIDTSYLDIKKMGIDFTRWYNVSDPKERAELAAGIHSWLEAGKHLLELIDFPPTDFPKAYVYDITRFKAVAVSSREEPYHVLET
jgi:hypothetical protein